MSKRDAIDNVTSWMQNIQNVDKRQSETVLPLCITGLKNALTCLKNHPDYSGPEDVVFDEKEKIDNDDDNDEPMLGGILSNRVYPYSPAVTLAIMEALGKDDGSAVLKRMFEYVVEAFDTSDQTIRNAISEGFFGKEGLFEALLGIFRIFDAHGDTDAFKNLFRHTSRGRNEYYRDACRELIGLSALYALTDDESSTDYVHNVNLISRVMRVFAGTE